MSTLTENPHLNGKVERSHRSDQEEFYQLLTYTDDVDLNKKLGNGKGSTTSIAHMEHLMVKHHTRH